ncbi:MAG: hypothetical protein U1F43_37620 [Myxococcota bacterium]
MLAHTASTTVTTHTPSAHGLKVRSAIRAGLTGSTRPAGTSASPADYYNPATSHG